MTLSLSRKIALFLIEIGMQVLWVFDKATTFVFDGFLIFAGKFLLFFIPFLFFIFLGYSYFTGYLNKVAEGFFLADNQGVVAEVKMYPVLVGTSPQPEITAKSAIAMERKKGRLLFEKNPNDELPPASTVKLMTAIVSYDLYNSDDFLTVPEVCTKVEGTKAWFPEEILFKVEDLIKSMLIGSSGDSACVLAVSKIDENKFVDLMNEKAKEIGMKSTIFSNSIGLDNINGGHHSTASDLLKLSIYATSISGIKEAVGLKNYVLSSVGGGFVANVVNTNKLIWELPGTIGVKTGTTEGAGEVLIYEYEDDLKDILIIVMGSRDRFNDTRIILDWINDNYSWN